MMERPIHILEELMKEGRIRITIGKNGEQITAT
jgi:hypothetical protein